MFYNEILRTSRFDEKKAILFGFKTQGDGVHTWEKPLTIDDLLLYIYIDEKNFEVTVLTLPDRDIFTLFELKDSEGAFIGSVREEVDTWVQHISKQCFSEYSFRNKILAYCKEKYETVPEYPWKQYPTYCTLKTERAQKWYGIIMHIPYRSLGLDQNGFIDVLNVKLQPAQIETLVDNETFFPAYHMNKKYWISIMLHRDADLEEIYSLIDASYALVEKK